MRRLIFTVLAVLCCVFLAEVPCIAASPSSKEADALYNELLKDKAYKEADGKMAAAYTKLMRGLDAEGQQKLRQEQRDWIRRRDTLLHDSPRQTLVSLAVAETERRQGELETKPAGSGRVSADKKNPGSQEVTLPKIIQPETLGSWSSEPENAREGDTFLSRFESLIDQEKYTEAKRLVSEFFRSGAASAGPKAQADASYCHGVIAFLSGGDDVNAKQHLEKALSLYQQDSHADEMRLLKTLFFIEALYFELKMDKRNRNNAQDLVLKKIIDYRVSDSIFSSVQSKISRILELNVCLNYDRTEEGGRIFNIKKFLKDCYLNGGGWFWISSFLEKSHSSRTANRKEGIIKLNKLKNEREDRIKKNISDINETLLKAIDLSEKNKKNPSIAIFGFDINSVFGFGPSSLTPWAYEFLGTDLKGVLSLEQGRPERIIFQNSEFVVTCATETANANWQHEISRLLFYDARTMELITILSLPNVVAQVGLIPDSS
ncbi:MAG: DUF1311 domain-containing protein, partial [Methylococcaceae bacterium]|nr:DUF1311 domain-containing protein [Methylococcaceae bacterium]